MVDYTVTVNNTDISKYIERDSYEVTRSPVLTDTITTLDGVDHVVAKRYKDTLRFSFNPMDADTTATIASLLLHHPLTVTYHRLQTNLEATSNMMLDDITLQYLSRCLYRGQKWNSADKIVLTEL